MMPAGRQMASSSSDQTVRIWDTHNARLQCVLDAHKNWVWSVDVSPVGNHLASGDCDGMVRIWSYHEA
jgi:WD40 repeat protein